MRGFDASVLRSSRLVNLDSEGEYEATVSCAGGVRSHIFFDSDKEDLPEGYSSVMIEVGGLFGGHSGADVNLGEKARLRLSRDFSMPHQRTVTSVCPKS